jgi:tripartite-type tricarboxylate transporter receptor subunit TctC
MAPGGTPDAIVDLLQREVRQALDSIELKDSFRQRDIWVVGSTSAEAAARINAGFRLWADVVKRTGMKGD